MLIFQQQQIDAYTKTETDNLLSAFTGSANITTLGTISTGVWNGTALTANYVPNHDSLNGIAGNKHIDWTASTSQLKTTLTTTQARLAYDASKYTDFLTDAAGRLNITPSGGRVYINGSNQFYYSNNYAGIMDLNIINESDDASSYARLVIKSGTSNIAQGSIGVYHGAQTNFSDSMRIRTESNVSNGIVFETVGAPIKFNTSTNTTRMMIEADGGVYMYNLPNTNPGVVNEVWADSTDGYTLKLSQG